MFDHCHCHRQFCISFVCFVFSEFQRPVSQAEAWQAERKKRRVARPSGTIARGRILLAADPKALQCHAAKDEATQRTGTLVFWLIVLAFLS